MDLSFSWMISLVFSVIYCCCFLFFAFLFERQFELLMFDLWCFYLISVDSTESDSKLIFVIGTSYVGCLGTKLTERT